MITLKTPEQIAGIREVCHITADMFNELMSAGAFDAFTSQRIFEESGMGILAGL